MGILLLKEVLADIDSADESLTIYIDATALPHDTSAVALVKYVGPGTVAPTGMKYFLSIEDAKGAIDTWSKWRGGRRPTDSDRCEAVIHYARMDAYLPVTST